MQTIVIDVGPSLLRLLQGLGTIMIATLLIWVFFKD